MTSYYDNDRDDVSAYGATNADYVYGTPIEDIEGPTDIEASDAPIELGAPPQGTGQRRQQLRSRVAADLPTEPQQRPHVSAEPISDLATLLREEFGERHVPTQEVIIPGRSEWSLSFRLDWSETAARRWAARAKEKVTKENPAGINFTRLYTQIIFDQCVDVLLNGRSVLQPGPYRKVLADPVLLEAIDETRPEGAVRFFLPVFAQLQSVGTTVQRLAGEGEGMDPTEYPEPEIENES